MWVLKSAQLGMLVRKHGGNVGVTSSSALVNKKCAQTTWTSWAAGGPAVGSSHRCFFQPQRNGIARCREHEEVKEGEGRPHRGDFGWLSLRDASLASSWISRWQNSENKTEFGCLQQKGWIFWSPKGTSSEDKEKQRKVFGGRKSAL